MILRKGCYFTAEGVSSTKNKLKFCKVLFFDKR